MFKHIFLCRTYWSVHVQTHISVHYLHLCHHVPIFQIYIPSKKNSRTNCLFVFVFFFKQNDTFVPTFKAREKTVLVLVLVGRQVSSDSLVGVDRRQQRRNGSKDTLHCDALVCSYSMQPGLRAACPCAWLPIYFAPNCSTSALHWSLQKVFQSNASHFTVHADGTSVQV